MENRERWGSRVKFILAAIGSAVGLGNFWRFPFLVYRFGGGPFLVPYVLSLLLVGLPLLLLEVSLGQRTQRGDIEAFGAIAKRFRAIGVISVFAAFGIVGYYAVILAWIVYFLVRSFETNLPYKQNSANFFFCQVLRARDWAGCSYTVTVDSDETEGRAGFSRSDMMHSLTLSGPLLAALVFVWIVIYFSLHNGVRATGNIVMYTVPIPVILLIILVISGGNLDGSKDGVHAYLGRWDEDAFENGSMWREAMSQIFFSLSVGFGVMTAYGSYTPKSQNIVADSVIIALCNTAISFLAGFVVYSHLGFLAKEECEDTPNTVIDGENFGCMCNSGPCKIDDRVVEIGDAGGVGLAFIVFPSAIAQIGGGSHADNFFAVLFFATLFLLGIDSAFSLVEAVSTVIHDTLLGEKHSKRGITGAVCAASFLCGFLYISDVGLFWLDLMDHYINNWLMLVIGFLEVVAVGWFVAYKTRASTYGASSTFLYTVFTLLAVVLGCLLGVNMVRRVDDISNKVFEVVNVTDPDTNVTMEVETKNVISRDRDDELMYLAVALPVAAFLFLVGAILAIVKKAAPLDAGFWLGGPSTLANAVNAVGRKYNNWQIRGIWSILIKYICPPAIFLMVVLGGKEDMQRHYEGYAVGAIQVATWYVFFIYLLGAIVFLFPALLDGNSRPGHPIESTEGEDEVVPGAAVTPLTTLGDAVPATPLEQQEA